MEVTREWPGALWYGMVSVRDCTHSVALALVLISNYFYVGIKKLNPVQGRGQSRWQSYYTGSTAGAAGQHHGDAEVPLPNRASAFLFHFNMFSETGKQMETKR